MAARCSARTRRSTNRVRRQALKLAATSLSCNDSALGAFYRRLCSRMNKPRADTAVAHRLARTVYFMLTRGAAHVPYTILIGLRITVRDNFLHIHRTSAVAEGAQPSDQQSQGCGAGPDRQRPTVLAFAIAGS